MHKNPLYEIVADFVEIMSSTAYEITVIAQVLDDFGVQVISDDDWECNDMEEDWEMVDTWIPNISACSASSF